LNPADPHQLALVIEALLLAAGQPLSIERLGELFDEDERPTPRQLRDACAVLAEQCRGRALELVEVASGMRLQVRADYARWVGRLREEKPARYSRALLETLALIAWRQPVTRGEIEEVRGVAVNSNIIRTLQERDWIRVVGHREVPGRPALLATTRAFLDHFNLASLDQLPPLGELRDLLPATAPDADDTDGDAPIPAGLQARADALLADGSADVADESEGHERPEDISFRSLLAELDRMEQGLKSDFEDQRPATDDAE